jgi:hypothetical protein
MFARSRLASGVAHVRASAQQGEYGHALDTSSPYVAVGVRTLPQSARCPSSSSRRCSRRASGTSRTWTAGTAAALGGAADCDGALPPGTELRGSKPDWGTPLCRLRAMAEQNVHATWCSLSGGIGVAGGRPRVPRLRATTPHRVDKSTWDRTAATGLLGGAAVRSGAGSTRLIGGRCNPRSQGNRGAAISTAAYRWSERSPPTERARAVSYRRRIVAGFVAAPSSPTRCSLTSRVARDGGR